MAKPLNARITSARSTDRISNQNLAALIDELHEETARLDTTHATVERDRVDLALTEKARSYAAAKAARIARLLVGYAEALTELEAKLQAKLAREARLARLRTRAAVKADRDALAERWRTVWPRVTAELIALFQATLANDRQLAAAGLNDEPSAEAVARGLIRNFSDGVTYYDRFTQTKLMPLQGHRRVWPPEAQPGDLT